MIYSTALKTARMSVVVNAIDAGALGGTIEIGTTGMASVLATITLDAVSGTVTDGVIFMSSFPKSDTNAAATGVATEARIRDSNGVDIITGLTVGLNGSDIVLDNLSIVTGQIVTLYSAVIAHG